MGRRLLPLAVLLLAPAACSGFELHVAAHREPPFHALKMECGWLGSVVVTDATYGRPCLGVQPGNVLAQVAADCAGLANCVLETCPCNGGPTCQCPDKAECFPPTSKCFVDPAPNCVKGFDATYSCSGLWGVVFCAGFFATALAYVGGGVGWAVKVQGKPLSLRPMAEFPHPHRPYWALVLGLAQDGLQFTLLKGR
eukprot:SAG22_NODE_2083_length_3036_cov_7.310861_3_plen_196_part_00